MQQAAANKATDPTSRECLDKEVPMFSARMLINKATQHNFLDPVTVDINDFSDRAPPLMSRGKEKVGAAAERDVDVDRPVLGTAALGLNKSDDPAFRLT